MAEEFDVAIVGGRVLDTEFGAINVGQWYNERVGRMPLNFGIVASLEMHRMPVLDQLEIDGSPDAMVISCLRARS
jgi:N-acyl-D-amino-acid deacylase